MAKRCYHKCIAKMAKERRMNMPTNSNLLRGRIAEKGLTQKEVAEMIGITYQSFSEKINNKSHFKVSEIIKLCDILGIVDKDSYFFADI